MVSHFIYRVVALCAVMCIPATVQADYLYMGGKRTFAPLADTDTLIIQGGNTAWLPLRPGTAEDVRLTAIFDSPLNRKAVQGYGFALATGTEEPDTLRIMLQVRRPSDTIYENNSQLHVHVYSTSHKQALDTTYIVKTAEQEYMVRDKALFTLGIVSGADGGSMIFVSGGDNTSYPIWSTTERLIEPSEITAIGLVAGEGKKETVVYRALLISSEPKPSKNQILGDEEIAQRIANATDPYSGYWRLLDYSVDDKQLRKGGTYTLAILPDSATTCSMPDRYEIVYISGADVQGTQWHSGMYKGEMRATPLSGVYALKWIDAEGEELEAEGTLQFSGTDICVINFPGFNAAFRLHRLSQP